MKLNKLMIALVVMMSSFAAVAQAQVAKIGETSFASLQAAIDAAEAGQTITLAADLSVDTETYTVGADKSVVLDMNGKTITVADNKNGTNSSANYALFYIEDGNLTVTGNGAINLKSTYNRAWNAMSVLFHNRGGVLTIQNGTFKNLGGTDMAFVVDNSGNYYGDATTNIYGGTLYSTYTAIRNYMDPMTNPAIGKVYLNIYGGNINGGTSAIWAQSTANESNPPSAPARGEINISGGEIGTVNSARGVWAETMTTISGGTVASFKGEVGELVVNGGTITGDVTILTSAGEVADYVVNQDGAYVEKGNAVASVGAKEFTDIYAAFDAANGKVVTILQDLELTKTILVEYNYDVTVEGSGKTITFVGVEQGFQVETGATLTLGEGLTIVGSGANVCPINIEYATVVTAANITTTSGNASAAISHTQGSANLTINGGTITAEAAAAINWTSVGTLTVNGGTIQGASAINHKSGALAINGGEFNGVNAAVAIETKGGKTAVTAVAINGGTFTSETTDAVVSTSSDINVGAMTNFITGGTFSSNVESLVALGYKVVDNGDGTYSVVRDETQTYVAQVGAKYYVSFAEAIAALMPMSELVLLEDITLTETVKLEVKSTILNLNGHTVTANCRKAFEVYAGTTIKNGTILSGSRCVDTRNAVNLVLENLTLKATSKSYESNPQPITIGGYNHGTVVEMSNVRVGFEEGCAGYSIISFVKTNLTATDCKFTNAYNVLYAREDNASGSVFTFNKCNMYAKSPAGNEPSNYFALIAVRANAVTVNINDCLLQGEGQVSAINLHGSKASNTAESVYAEGCTIKLSADTEVIGDLILESNKNFSKNTIILPATDEYINKLTEENFLIIDNGDGTVTPSKNLDLVDGDFAYTNKEDLEGMEISYKRTFANAGVWNAVFLPFDVPASALADYDVAEFTNVLTEADADNKVTAWGLELTMVDSIKANTPCFVRAKTEAAKNFNIKLSNVTLYGAIDGPHATNSNAYMALALTGNYESIEYSEAFKSGGWVVSGSGKFVHSTSGMKPFRLYLTRDLMPGVELNIAGNYVMRILVRKPNGTTSIENVDAEAIGQQATTATYDLQGREVVNATKGGIYIVNGKKVVKD